MKILVVEDQFKLARSLERGLKQEGFVVDVERNFADGLSSAESGVYDVLILDRMMPGGDGLEIVSRIREQKNSTPCLMLTAKDEIEARVEGLDSGADDYLIKPFAFDELLARINALLRRPKESASVELSCGEVTLNPQSKTVKFNSENIELTKKEFSLLEYLLRNKGVVISKQQLLNHVWDFDADILPNTVEAFVNSIRKKIDKKYSVDIIKTVRGHGYKIECS